MTDDKNIMEELDTPSSEYVYRFVKKPLKKNEIKQAVKMAIKYYKTIVGSKEHATST
jgi:hypothetical protein